MSQKYTGLLDIHKGIAQPIEPTNQEADLFIAQGILLHIAQSPVSTNQEADLFIAQRKLQSIFPEVTFPLSNG